MPENVSKQNVMFLNSELNVEGNGIDFKVHPPRSAFSTNPPNTLRLCASQFVAQKFWRDCNSSNSTFWLCVGEPPTGAPSTQVLMYPVRLCWNGGVSTTPTADFEYADNTSFQAGNNAGALNNGSLLKHILDALNYTFAIGLIGFTDPITQIVYPANDRFESTTIPGTPLEVEGDYDNGTGLFDFQIINGAGGGNTHIDIKNSGNIDAFPWAWPMFWEEQDLTNASIESGIINQNNSTNNFALGSFPFSTINYTPLQASPAEALSSAYRLCGGRVSRRGVYASANNRPVFPEVQTATGPGPFNGQTYDRLTYVQGGSGWYCVPNPVGGNQETMGWTSIYPAQLSTLDEIYLRTDLPNSNYQTIGLEQPNQYAPLTMMNTTILAKIPLPLRMEANSEIRVSPSIPEATEVYRADRVVWESPTTAMQSLALNGTTLNQFRIRLTDSADRPIPITDPRQAQQGNANCKLSLLYQVIYHAPTPNTEQPDDKPLATAGEMVMGGANTNEKIYALAQQEGDPYAE